MNDVNEKIVAKPAHRIGRPPGSMGAKAIVRQAQNMMIENSKKLLPLIGVHYSRLEPKEIMLIAARLSAFKGNWAEAAQFAAMAAPYFNRRLANLSIDHKVSYDVKDMSDEDLQSYLTVTETNYEDVENQEQSESEENETDST
jgi:hypothetical protein